MACTKGGMRRMMIAAAAAAGFAGMWPGLASALPVNSLPEGPIACGAVVRHAGAWTVRAPMTVATDQGPLHFSPGQTFGPGYFLGRVEPSAIFDRNCGNP
ncbi:MAG TPA: hypothetical protein VGR91_11250 [Stellaceae bacterium]|nr:hypothetical protein [Stellaceae bacterium]